MNDLQVFQNERFGAVRTVIREGQPWFVAADVCRALELSNPTVAVERLDEDERAKLNLGRQGEGAIVNEPGLYTLVLGSRKPEAKTFKRWITHEVIPAIRQTGGYVGNDDLFLQTYLPYADESTKAMFRATLATINDQNRKISEQGRKIEQDAPKVLFASSVEASGTGILIGALAKILRQNGVEVGQNRLFERMRKDGYLISRPGSDWNMPSQRSMEAGFMRIKESTVTHADGHISVNKTPIVTGKGQVFFINKYRGAFGPERPC